MKIYCPNHLLCLWLIKHHTLRICKRLEAQIHTFLAPAPNGSELEVLAPGKGSRFHSDKGWRSYGTRLSLLPHLIYFLCPTNASVLWRIYVCIQISDCVEIVYELPFLQNNTASETFYTNREWCEVLIGYLSLESWPGGDWANTWHWTKRFTIFCSKGR